MDLVDFASLFVQGFIVLVAVLILSDWLCSFYEDEDEEVEGSNKVLDFIYYHSDHFAVYIAVMFVVWCITTSPTV